MSYEHTRICMYPRGHSGITMIAMSPLIFLQDLPEMFILYLCVTVLFSVVPDFDALDIYPISKISHRGITHTVWFGIFCSLILFSVLSTVPLPVIELSNQQTVTLSACAAAGVLFHIIGDIINEDAGVAIFNPIIQYEVVLGLVDSTGIKNDILFFVGSGMMFLLLASIS